MSYLLQCGLRGVYPLFIDGHSQNVTTSWPHGILALYGPGCENKILDSPLDKKLKQTGVVCTSDHRNVRYGNLLINLQLVLPFYPSILAIAFKGLVLKVGEILLILDIHFTLRLILKSNASMPVILNKQTRAKQGAAL